MGGSWKKLTCNQRSTFRYLLDLRLIHSFKMTPFIFLSVSIVYLQSNTAQAEWFLGIPMENCDTVCGKNGLICTEAEFAANNNDVDSSEEVLALIKKLGGKTTAKSCSKGDFPAVPLFNKEGICMYSNGQRINRPEKFECKRVAGPQEDNKQRLCYCHVAKLSGYTKLGVGYCRPQHHSKAVLCQKKPDSPACEGVNSKSKYFLDKKCDASCAQERCNLEPDCVGYTKRISDSRYKLQSKIDSTSDDKGHECWTKDEK